MTKRRRLALIYGGEGEEHEVSLAGAKSILPLIDTEKYSVLKIKIEQDGSLYRISDGGKKTPLSFIRRKNRGGALIGERFYPIAVAFPLLHGRLGEDGVVQGMLRMLRIPFVGCDTASGSLCFDKHLTKLVAKSIGIPVADHVLLLPDGDLDSTVEEAEQSIGYPLFVKPARQGSSVGAALAENRGALIAAVKTAMPYSEGGILIEEAVTDKRELEVAYLSAGGRVTVTPPGEILCRGTYGYGEKYSRPSPTRAVAEVSPDIAKKTEEYTLRLARALGVRALGRFDFFCDGERLLFNEVNTMPGFTDSSLYAAMLEKAGISRRELVSLLLDCASC